MSKDEKPELFASLAHPERKLLTIPDAGAAGWVINNISVHNTFVPPETPAQLLRRQTYEVESAACHRAAVARTLMGGPGNHSRIMRCYCGITYDEHARATGSTTERYAAHIGVDPRVITAVLSLQDAYYDAVDYPNEMRHGLFGDVTMRQRLENAVAHLVSLTEDARIQDAARSLLASTSNMRMAPGIKKLGALTLERQA